MVARSLTPVNSLTEKSENQQCWFRSACPAIRARSGSHVISGGWPRVDGPVTGRRHAQMASSSRLSRPWGLSRGVELVNGSFVFVAQGNRAATSSCPRGRTWRSAARPWATTSSSVAKTITATQGTCGGGPKRLREMTEDRNRSRLTGRPQLQQPDRSLRIDVRTSIATWGPLGDHAACAAVHDLHERERSASCCTAFDVRKRLIT
jgi:hypothetical protein